MTATLLSHDAQSGAVLAEWFRAQAPQLNALLSEWAVKAAQFENCDGWRGAGMRSCAHWLVDECGISRPFAEALLRAGHCAEQLPEVREAFRRGDLSLEKVRLISTVANEDTQGEWVDQAMRTTPGQLARHAREARTPGRDDPEGDRLQRSLRYLKYWNDEIGMLRISGVLPKTDGHAVKAVLDQYANSLREQRRRGIRVELDPPEDQQGAHRADALVAVCLAAAGGGADARPLPVQMVVHVDLDVLTGENPAGRGHLEDGPALPRQMLAALGCDASVKVVVERDGVEVGATRAKEIVSAPLRRKLQSRDRFCRFPGCALPAAATDAHHIQHKEAHGPTVLWNLLSLCEFHHQSLHRREWGLVRTDLGDLVFEARDGRVIGAATGGWWRRPARRNKEGP